MPRSGPSQPLDLLDAQTGAEWRGVDFWLSLPSPGSLVAGECEVATSGVSHDLGLMVGQRAVQPT